MLFNKQPTPTAEERIAVHSKFEIVITYSPKGSLVSARIGTREQSSLPAEPEDGSIFSHNHPKGRGPSDGDLNYALQHPSVTMRIVAINELGKFEIFQMKGKKDISPDEIRAIAFKYKTACDRKDDTPLARRDAYELLSEMFPDIIELQRRTL